MSGDRLRRYLFIGNTDAAYYAKSKTVRLETVPYCSKVNEQLKALAPGTSSNSLLDIVKKTMMSGDLLRKDEAIYFLVYCVQTTDSDELKQNIYNLFETLFTDQKDLFFFIHHYINFTPDKKQGLSRGLKSAIVRWYGSRKTEDLANMIGIRHEFYGYTHNDIFRLTHAHFKDQKEKEHLVEASFNKISKLVKSENTELLGSPGVARLIALHQLRQIAEPEALINYIKENSISFDEIPLNLKKYPEVWEHFLPTLPYQTVLGALLMLNDYQLLQPNHSFSKMFTFKIGNPQAVADSKIHPIEILAILRLFSSNIRYLAPVKESYRAKKIAKLSMKPNDLLKKKLTLALNHSMNHFPITGCRYYITIDIRTGSFQRTVYSMSQLKCMEVSLLMALGLYKREKDVTVMTFTNEAQSLKKVDMDKNMSFEKAMEYIEIIKEETTLLNLATPIEKAMKDKKKIDVFITIVDSVGHATKGKRIAPYAALENYRQTIKLKKARYVIINLSRQHKDLDTEYQEGILEIVGFSPEAPKVIEAYAKNVFK